MRNFELGSRKALLLLLGLASAVLLSLCGQAFADASSFGANSFSLGTVSSQASEHSDLEMSFKMNLDSKGEPIGQLKDVQATLPTGLTGNPFGAPKCSAEEFQLLACKPPAQVGYILIDFNVAGEIEPIPIALFNLDPVGGHLVTLAGAFIFAKVVIQVDLANEGLSVKVENLSTLLPILGASLKIWAVPASSSHDLERSRTQTRGTQPIYGENEETGETEIIGIEPTPAGVAPAPFLTSPADCSVPQQSTLSVDSWQEPGHYIEPLQSVAPPPTGCDQLRSEPQVTILPDTTQQDTPAGYDVRLHDPLDQEAFDLGTPPLRKVAITLPPGASLSPAVGTGLAGCSDEQFDSGACPEASKVGTVNVTTPLLSEPLTGSAYIGSSTPSEMYRIFIKASARDVSLSLEGVVTPDPLTGQLTIAFEEMPQLPFEDLDLHLFGGPEAALANPTGCGNALTSSQLASYAGQSNTSFSSFDVDANGLGGACPAIQPYDPSFSMGTASPRAGAFSPFTLTVSRGDGQQTLSTIDAKLPAGLVANLSSVPPCAQAQAAQGECPLTSQIGTTTVGAGPGAHPLWLDGNVYLTGPYEGAPFGLAIVVHAVAGPFDLGTIVIRAQILIDSRDLHLTILSDPLPQILKGIPLRIQALNLNIDRPNFILNPTNCAHKTILGTSASAQGASVSSSASFQVAGCSGLPFKPKMTVTTRPPAKSATTGASLSLNLTTNRGNANIRSVAIRLPKQVQSRLTSLRNACPAGVFTMNRHMCPAASVVGSARIGTLVLSVPLTGPVYLVSHGRSGLPALQMVLEGEGIAVELDGQISVNKQNVTRSAFESLPDVPISSFELNFPEGPNSLLGAVANLCSQKLVMPAAITAQNGAQIKQSSVVNVSGCPRKRARQTSARKRS